MNTLTKSQLKQSGLTLVELMIAMTIGLVLISGTLFVYSNARAAYSTNESYALMQENARFALSVLEPDLQLAGYWGQHRSSYAINGKAADRDIGTNLTGIGNDCDTNWAIRFSEHIEGYNDVNAGFNALACIPPTNLTVGSDVFAIRRVDGTPVTVLSPGQIYMRSSEQPISEVFVGNNEPTSALPVTAENFEVVANAYYVRPGIEATSTTPARQPALRRVALTNVANASTMQDNEITTGIEDMQVQYGIGPADVNGVRSGVSVYVSDISALTPPNDTVRAMRIWLLMRAESKEFDYKDDKQYQLGDKTVTAKNDNYRRLVVSKTIFFRNLH